jgi:hypothetical protein
MLKHEFYLAYLNSAEWRMRRARVLKLAGYQCHRCGAKRPLEVHHKTYERLGAEWDQDLEVLCATCHEGVSEAEAPDSQEGKYFKFAREALRDDPFTGMANLLEAVKKRCAVEKIPYENGRITRAVNIVTGKRFTRPAWSQSVVGNSTCASITDADAHEVLARLQVVSAVKSMPLAGRSMAEQEAHEQKLRQQIAELQQQTYQAERRRRPLRERLEAIFSGDEP